MTAPGRRIGGRLTLLGLVACLASPSPAAAATLEVVLEPPRATVGDRVEARLVLTTEEGELAGEPRFPAWDERWGAAEIVEAGPVERGRSGEGAEHRQRLILTAFRTGELELPPRRVAVPGPDRTTELWTAADLTLRVASVLPEGEAAEAVEPEPPAPPRALPLGAPFWWTLAVLSLLAVGAVVLAARRHRPADRSPARRLAPREELAAALAEVRRAPAPEEGHVLLSQALRRYLGRSLGFPAVESTTSEVRRELRGRRVPAAVESRADELLRACDRVKFAREAVARETLEARIETAREVAAGLEAHLAPAPAEARAGARKEAA